MHCRRSDISIAVTLGAFALAAAYFLFGQIDPQIYYGQGEAGEDVWFDADSFTARALSAPIPKRKFAVELASLLILFAGLNNFLLFRAVTRLVVENKVAWIVWIPTGIRLLKRPNSGGEGEGS
jgi:hypothetical protein